MFARMTNWWSRGAALMHTLIAAIFGKPDFGGLTSTPV
jgi:hypothetical protein